MNRRLHHKKVPADDIRFQPGIYQFLRDRVKGQDTALNGIAAILSNMLLCREARVFKFTLGGAIGSGKKTTLRAIKQLLGMNEGQMYASQFVEAQGMLVNDASHRTGGRESVALMDRLRKARESVISMDTGKEEVLPYLCLFVDEVEKACSVFMDYVGQLLEHGRCVVGSSGRTLSLPKLTPLLVIFTSNCASSEISMMTKTDDLMAADLIGRALEQRWPNANAVKHLRPLLPYYPLKNETLEPILMEKFEEYVSKSALSNRFGLRSIQYADEVKAMLVRHVLARVDTTPGVQGSIGQLFYKLDTVFSMGLGVIQTMVAENEPLLRPILVTAHSIDTHRFAESLDKQLGDVIKEIKQQQQQSSMRGGGCGGLSTTQVIDSIFENPDNHQIMDKCDTSQKGTVEAVTMAYGDRPLCSLVVNITYNNYQVVNHLDQQEEVRHLKRRLTSYKNTLKEMIHTIDRTCTESSPFHSTMKKIADTKRELIESSNSSDDGDDDAAEEEATTTEKKRKRIRPLCLTNEASSLSLGPLSKRPRMEDEMMLDFSDEIELYTMGDGEDEYDDDDLAEEPEETLWCTKCEKLKIPEVFIRKRKDKAGILRSTQAEHCSTCRKCRK